MALGKLSAGLAHELNNPSAAIVRSAQELKKALATAPKKFKRVIKIQTNEGTVDKLNKFVQQKIQDKGKVKLTMLEKGDRECDLRSWMEEQIGVIADEGPDILADFNFTEDELTEIKSWFRLEDVAPVIEWIEQVLLTESLVNDIEEASRRINTLVTSVKGYTHMDQAPEKQKTDIHTGIRNTLTMLNHKLKKAGIKVIEDFNHNPPEANILVSEMNQVWTNLIDNALDAMEGRPGSVLEICSERHREFIWVCIIDNGPGIPDEVKDRIFDPFFTTKAIGKGTGLGLEVVRQIVLQHDGKVDVTSVPGRTEFKVCFPIG